MKKIIIKLKDRFDYLWTGDKQMLIDMWLVILLAFVLVIQTLATGYLTFF